MPASRYLISLVRPVINYETKFTISSGLVSKYETVTQQSAEEEPPATSHTIFLYHPWYQKKFFPQYPIPYILLRFFRLPPAQQQALSILLIRLILIHRELKEFSAKKKKMLIAISKKHLFRFFALRNMNINKLFTIFKRQLFIIECLIFALVKLKLQSSYFEQFAIYVIFYPSIIA